MRRGAGREEAAEDIDEVMEHRFKTNGFWATPPRATDSSTFDDQIRQHLNDCLDGVTTDQRVAFVLREVEEMNSDDYHELGFMKKVEFKLHLMTCTHCQRYVDQIKVWAR